MSDFGQCGHFYSLQLALVSLRTLHLHYQISSLDAGSFDAAGMMLDGDTCSGTELAAMICRMFDESAADYLRVHSAARGCYLARVDRISIC